MDTSSLTELEELILLAVGVAHGDAYGYAVKEVLKKETGRSVSLATVHAALYRLEEKGYVRSHLGGATSERGGRRKRLFTLTRAGFAVLREIHDVRARLWTTVRALYPAGGGA